MKLNPILLILLILISTGYSKMIENKNGEIFTQVNISDKKQDSIHESVLKDYKQYLSNYEFKNIVKVNPEQLKKRVKTLFDAESKRKRLGKKANRCNVELDSLLSLSDLVGKRMMMRIKAIDTTQMNIFRFYGYLERLKGTTWACFTIDEKGRLRGQVDGFEHRVINFESIEDSLVVGISIPFAVPGKKYENKKEY